MLKNRQQIKKDNDLFELCNKYFDRCYYSLTPNFYLPYAEKDDIKSEAIIRVFRKKHLYRKNKASWDTWIKSLIRNSIKNSLRNRFGDFKVKLSTRQFHNYVRYPSRLKARVQQTNKYLQEIIIIEPDIIDENSIFINDLEFLELKNILFEGCDKEQKSILFGLQAGKNLKQIAAELEIKYQTLYKKYNNLKLLYKNNLVQCL